MCGLQVFVRSILRVAIAVLSERHQLGTHMPPDLILPRSAFVDIVAQMDNQIQQLLVMILQEYLMKTAYSLPHFPLKYYSLNL